MPNPREVIEAWERERFSPRAALAAASKGRETSEPQDDLRTCFQRDRDRIIHSKAFRRLKHKTQVFGRALPTRWRSCRSPAPPPARCG